MALIIKKDCQYGKNIKLYARIGKFEYSLKNKHWVCFIEYYYNKEAAFEKKVADWLKEWVILNPDKINDNVFEYLQINYFEKQLQILPILIHSINIDNILNPWDFDNDVQIFEWLYSQIKNKPEIISANEYIEDVYENKDELLNPVLTELERIYNETS